MFYSAVQCSEVHTTNESEWSLEDFTASVVLRCAWDDRHFLAADLLGNQREWPHTPFVGRGPWAMSCSIRSDDADYQSSNQGCVYSHALVTVQYGMQKKDLVSESIEPNVEFQVLDHKLFRWNAKDGDPLIEGEAPGKQLRSCNLQRTLYQVTSVPAAVMNGIGGVNHVTYTSKLLGVSFAPETLLYTPPQLNRTITTSGSDGFTIQLKWAFKPEGWNKYWRGKSQQYEHIHLAGDNNPYKSYPPVDYSSILF